MSRTSLLCTIKRTSDTCLFVIIIEMTRAFEELFALYGATCGDCVLFGFFTPLFARNFDLYSLLLRNQVERT